MACWARACLSCRLSSMRRSRSSWIGEMSIGAGRRHTGCPCVIRNARSIFGTRAVERTGHVKAKDVNF
jgi:hypothetical protein